MHVHPLLKLRYDLTARSLKALISREFTKLVVLGSTTVLFLGLETLFFYRIFEFLFLRTEPALHIISRALSLQLLNMVFLVFSVMLLYSNLVTSISVFLTSTDMRMLLVWPVSSGILFLNKLLETLIRSSLVLAVFVIPVLWTYGHVRGAQWWYYLATPIWLVLFLFIPGAVATPLMLLLARIFPLRRLQQGLVALGLIAMTAGLFAFRLLKVEEVFFNAGRPDQLVLWASSFHFPEWSWAPGTWLIEAIDQVLVGGANGLRSAALGRLLVGALGLSVFSTLIGAPLLRRTWERSMPVPLRKTAHRMPFGSPLLAALGLGRGDAAIVLKEAKVFTRDLSRWSQVAMMIPLIGFYLLNMHLLPFRDQFREIYFLLNLFMIAFIQAAISARYLFPSISWEGPALWLLRVSPYPMWRLVVIKFVFLTVPLLILTGVLCYFSFSMLGFEQRHLRPSLILALSTTLLLTSMAMGFGAALPRFRYEHHLEIPLGPGGVLYMLSALSSSIVYVMLLALPMIRSLRGGLFEWGNWDFSKIHPPDHLTMIAWPVLCAAGTLTWLLFGIACLGRRQEFDR